MWLESFGIMVSVVVGFRCTLNEIIFIVMSKKLMLSYDSFSIENVIVGNGLRLRIGKIKGMNNRIINYSYRNTSATKPVNN